jgi:hypothetical protein
MSKKLLISCEEATSICNKNQYGEASIWDKIRLSLHSLGCVHCKTYSAQNNILTKLMGNHTNSCSNSGHLTDEDKFELEKTLNEKIKKTK